MAELASTDELALKLGLSEVQADLQDDYLAFLLDQAEALFTTATNRADIPFQDAEADRVEIIEAPTGRSLWLDYRVAEVTDVIVGSDLLNPEVTLDPTDASEVIWRAGKRDLVRMDATWRCRAPKDAVPIFVQVTYDTQADLPDDAKAAVLSLAAAGYHGAATASGTIQSETLDNYSVSYATAQQAMTLAQASDPAWAIAVARHKRLTLA
jgi:hypothetical protein